MRKAAAILATFLLQMNASAGAEPGETPPNPLTMAESIEFALAHYPAVAGRIEQTTASTEAVTLAQRAYLPRADLLWQLDFSSRNNIFGLLLPQSTLPVISGPVLPTTSGRGAVGTAVGGLLSWEPIDFGYRSANVASARSARARAEAALALTRLDVAVGVSAAFLSVAAADQAVKAAEADVERRRVLAVSTRTLAENELRPGADVSRADAELVAAEIRLAQARTDQKARTAELAQQMGVAGSNVQIDARPFLETMPTVPSAPPSTASAAHPAALATAATLSEAQAKRKAIARSFYPRLLFQAALSGRGSSANPDGTFSDSSKGFDLDRVNWAVGLTLSFAALDFLVLGPKLKLEAALVRAAQAQVDLERQDLAGLSDKAWANYQGALLIAQLTPVALAASRASETQAHARYQTGLAPIVEVAEAQRLLLETEVDDRVARLRIWRAWLSLCYAQGNLQPFLESLKVNETGP